MHFCFSGEMRKMSKHGRKCRKMSKLATKSFARTLFKDMKNFYNKVETNSWTGVCLKTEKRGNMNGADVVFSDGVCK